MKKTFLGILTTMMLLSFTTSSTKESFAASSIVPGARGYVRVKMNDLNNYAVNIRITDLMSVTQLQPPKHNYVVWMVSDQYITKNLGKLFSKTDAFPGKMKASFESITSLKPSKIFITAEDDATIQHPGVQVVLATNRF